MRTSSRRAAVVVLSLLASLLATNAFGSSGAGAATALPNGFGAIAVDAARGHVFISSPTANVVTVLDLGGAVVTTITGEPGANSLLLDGNVLYVATNAGTVDAIDATTLTRTTSFGAGTLTAPSTLASAAGRIWTTTSTCGSSPRLASIDPVGGAVTVHPPVASLGYCPQLVASPTDPNLLLGFDEGLSPTTFVKLDVSSGAPVVLVTQRSSSLSNGKQVAISPDGATFVAAAGAPYEIDELRMSDLQPNGRVYASGNYPNAVASTAANGGLVAGGRDAAYTPDVDVHRLGAPATRLHQTDFGSSSNTLYRRGLAFGPDGTRLYAVSGNQPTGTVTLNVLTVGTTPLPNDTTKGFGAVAVDATRNRVYISSPTAHAIRVFDLAGTQVGTISGVAGAGSLLVDGPTLYVAATAGGTIDAIDTTTLTRTASLGFGSVVKPNALVRAGGRLWTTNGACGSSSTGLTSIDPASGTTATFPPSTWLGYCPALTASPTDPNLVLAFDLGISPATITRFDVSTGTPVIVAQQRESQLGNLKQLAFAPDGLTFFAASGAPYEIDEFRTADLLPTGLVFTTGPYPNAVATTPAAGALLAAGRAVSTNPAANVFRLGGTAVLQPTLPTTENLLDRGLVFAPDGSALFTVSSNTSTGLVVLRAWAIAVPTTTQLTSATNPTVTGQPVTLTATVDLSGGGRATAGSVTFREGATVLGTAAVSAAGTATITIAPLAVGPHSITASFSGVAYAPSTSGTFVHDVAKAATTSAVASSANPVRKKTSVTFTATVAATAPGAGTPTGTVSFYDGATLLGSRSLTGGSAAFATSVLSAGTHTITVRYAGDANFTLSTSPALSQVVSAH